jgi:putative cardiolipin synthase
MLGPPWRSGWAAACGRLALCGAAAVVAACVASPPGPEHRRVSTALSASDVAATSLGRFFAGPAASHPGASGFELVVSGREAFVGRYALAARAAQTIDVQYFIWEADQSGRLLLTALLDAADRGVRVRLLLDDLHLEGRDAELAALDAHPNVEVRLFNPFVGRATHVFDFVLDFARVNHRMHNKAFIVDNAVAAVGGRNIGDVFFAVGGESNFRDIDLFATGPIVSRISESFDAFWNSAWAGSIRRVAHERPDPGAIRAMVKPAEPLDTPDPAFPFARDLAPARLGSFVRNLPARLIWGEASLLADRPDKPATSAPGVLEGLRAEAGKPRRDLLLESAYFVPARSGVERLCKLVAEGVDLRVLTNSAATNDELAAFAGYAKHREALLRCGVELDELRSDADFIKKHWRWLKGHSTAVLHTKAAVFDHRKVLIGSFNMDPRSAYLNTELALLVDSAALAAKVTAFIEEGRAPENAYHLALDADGRLIWTARQGGTMLRLDAEPDIGLWKSLGADLISILPIDPLL